MNTCPTCQNDLVCPTHRAMSDTPETDVYATHKNDVYEFVDPEWDWVVSADFARNLERQLAEARQACADKYSRSAKRAAMNKSIEA